MVRISSLDAGRLRVVERWIESRAGSRWRATQHRAFRGRQTRPVRRRCVCTPPRRSRVVGVTGVPTGGLGDVILPNAREDRAGGVSVVAVECPAFLAVLAAVLAGSRRRDSLDLEFGECVEKHVPGSMRPYTYPASSRLDIRRRRYVGA